MDFKNNLDFKLEFNVDRDIKVLQITDMQPVDVSQQRYDGRLDYAKFNDEFTEEMKYKNEFYYIEKAIKESNPDLIIVTGDIVYGEFDDNGKNLLEFINYMDSCKIPWAPVFGNHDNECKLGVTWQCEQFNKAKYCLFNRNNVTGNGNYNIGIFNHNKLIRVIYMMDSNGAWHGKTYGYIKDYPSYNVDEHLERMSGIYPDQIEYMRKTCEEIDNINKFKVNKTMCSHIPPNFINKFAMDKGYQRTAEEQDKDMFDLGGDELIDNKDFGTKEEQLGGFGCDSWGIYKTYKDYNFDTVFVGHEHINNLSIDCDGVRVTFGVKTSTFDYHNKVGYTVFSFNADNYHIKHYFLDKI